MLLRMHISYSEHLRFAMDQRRLPVILRVDNINIFSQSLLLYHWVVLLIFSSFPFHLLWIHALLILLKHLWWLPTLADPSIRLILSFLLMVYEFYRRPCPESFLMWVTNLFSEPLNWHILLLQIIFSDLVFCYPCATRSVIVSWSCSYQATLLWYYFWGLRMDFLTQT